MGKGLRPDFCVDAITHITTDWLKKKKINVIYSDIDNTIALHDGMEIPSSVQTWIEEVRSCKIEFVLVSNNDEKRVKPLAAVLGAEYIARAGKPSGKKIRQVRNMAKENGLFVGDQIFTDILCGNRCGMYTVLTKPLGPDPLIQIKIKRFFEKMISKKWSSITLK